MKIICGDALQVLKTLPSESVHCCVTSPPYWGLRDYGVDGQIGLEETLDEWLEKIVQVFREVRRVLRSDGTLWLNLGDSYCGGGRGGIGDKSTLGGGRNNQGESRKALAAGKRNLIPTNLKPKDLLGQPWMVAFALRADGWYLRSDIIWHKPNPIPESVTDRPTKSHEYLFLLTKSAKYFYDQEAISEPVGRACDNQPKGLERAFSRRRLVSPENRQDDFKYGSGNRERFIAKEGERGRLNTHLGSSVPWDATGKGRNKRTVWTIATEPFPESHFATFPTELVRPCILAGTSEKGCCPECGSGWVRIVETEYVKSPVHGEGSQIGKNGCPHNMTGMPRVARQDKTIGFRPSCSHYNQRYKDEFPRVRSKRKHKHQDMADQWFRRARKRPGKNDWPIKPCVVADPFSGSARTGLVAVRLKRDFIGIELNPKYCIMGKRQIENDNPLFNKVEVV
jgi:DNA modification methylase